MLTGHDQCVCVCIFIFYFSFSILSWCFLPLGNQKKQAADHRMGGFFFEKKGQSQISLRRKRFEIVRVRQ